MVDANDLLEKIIKTLEDEYLKGSAGKKLTKEVGIYFNSYLQDVSDMAGVFKEMWSLGHITPLISKKMALVLNRSIETIILASVGQGLVAADKAKSLSKGILDATLQLLLQFILGI